MRDPIVLSPREYNLVFNEIESWKAKRVELNKAANRNERRRLASIRRKKR